MVLEEQILILDDEQFNLDLLSKSLAQHSLKTFTDQQAMLDQANAATPCILLDVSMPGLSGYEVCEELRKQSETSNTPILFVSGHDSLQARLKGYAAGGDDYICKPFDIPELQAKVDRAIESGAYRKSLSDQADVARQTAFEAMTHSSEQGQLALFMEQAFNCTSPAELAQSLVACLKSFGLNAVTAFWQQGEVSMLGHAEKIAPLEAELLRQSRHGGRIVDFAQRSIFNFSNCSLLIKNMPQQASTYGRFKDHLCVLMSGVEARLKSLQVEAECHQQQELLSIAQKAESALSQLQKNNIDNINLANQEAVEMVMELTEELLILNLDEQQELQIIELIKAHVEKLRNCYEKGNKVDDDISMIVSALKKIANS
jgi:DNA-binding response OmpR family regulator